MENQTRPEVLAKVIAIADDLGLLAVETSSITEETELNGIMDSMDVLELGMALEKTSKKPITDASIESWITFGDIVSTYLLANEDE